MPLVLLFLEVIKNRSYREVDGRANEQRSGCKESHIVVVVCCCGYCVSLRAISVEHTIHYRPPRVGDYEKKTGYVRSFI